MTKQLIAILIIIVPVVLMGIALAADAAVQFPHKKHLDAGAKCETCHVKAAASVLSTDKIRPKSEQCIQCHDNTPATTWHKAPIYDLYFSHHSHIVRQAQCQSCHQVETNSLDMSLPKHEKCYGCHDDNKAEKKCSKCHIDSVAIKPANHDTGWVQTHGSFATSEVDNCAKCHKEQSCDSCHMGVNLTQNTTHHPESWRAMHSEEARSDRNACYSCHDERRFCADCHTRLGSDIKPESHAPLAWRMGDHGKQAQLDMESCASCHDSIDKSPICLSCHSNKQGFGFNPHESGFARSFGYGPWHTDDGYVCYQCHNRDDNWCERCHD